MPTGTYVHRPRVVRVSRTCEICGRVREYTPGQITQREGRGATPIRYCSTKCRDLGMIKAHEQNHVAALCEVCGTPVDRHVAHVRGHIYCSKQCADDARRMPGARWRDPAAIAAYMHHYHQRDKATNPEKYREWGRRYRRDHSRKLANAARARRAGAAVGSFSDDQWEAMKAHYDYRCLCCGRAEPEIKLEQDHIIPVVRRGQHTAANIQPLCRSCNARKSRRTTDYRPTSRGDTHG